MVTREFHEDLEERVLAGYAMKSRATLGREHPAQPDKLRTEFQRDRDRIIHSVAFRKLEFKTQVHTITAGDYYRTRITHTLEVAQIARTMARALRVNGDLAEAIALAHDFGHTPFGHAGEMAMQECMAEAGGFEHNEQGLRVVEILEERSPKFPGLNLTFEVREGIIKHDTDYDKPAGNARYLPEARPTVESQICDLADEVAYNNADLDDALKMGVIHHEDLRAVPWVGELIEEARHDLGHDAADKLVTYRALSKLYDAHVNDALEFTTRRIAETGVATVDDVRALRGRLVDFSPAFKERVAPLKKFLFQRVYFHPDTLHNSLKAQRMLKELFRAYFENNGLLPWKYQKRIAAEGRHRVICDYIAGMTDRYFNEQYARVFYPENLRPGTSHHG